MQRWNLKELETPGGSRSPIVLQSEESAARAVLIGLEPGQQLGEHEVKEHAFVLVVDGTVEVDGGNESIEASAGTLFQFEPEERHALSTASGAKLLLLLAPWPGPGHYRGGGERAAGAAR